VSESSPTPERSQRQRWLTPAPPHRSASASPGRQVPLQRKAARARFVDGSIGSSADQPTNGLGDRDRAARYSCQVSHFAVARSHCQREVDAVSVCLGPNDQETVLRYFIAYHNEQKMGYSCTAIPTPRVKTSKPVAGTEGSTVWLIAGEGKSPKSYYLAAKFSVEKCEPGKHLGTELPNEVSGPGLLLGKSIKLSGTPLLSQLQKLSANFVHGFCEVRDVAAIAALKALA
jgi:hypothetical protein